MLVLYLVCASASDDVIFIHAPVRLRGGRYAAAREAQALDLDPFMRSMFSRMHSFFDDDDDGGTQLDALFHQPSITKAPFLVRSITPIDRLFAVLHALEDRNGGGTTDPLPLPQGHESDNNHSHRRHAPSKKQHGSSGSTIAIQSDHTARHARPPPPAPPASDPIASFWMSVCGLPCRSLASRLHDQNAVTSLRRGVRCAAVVVAAALIILVGLLRFRQRGSGSADCAATPENKTFLDRHGRPQTNLAAKCRPVAAWGLSDAGAPYQYVRQVEQ
jgi:hypothetical protein